MHVFIATYLVKTIFKLSRRGSVSVDHGDSDEHCFRRYFLSSASCQRYVDRGIRFCSFGEIKLCCFIDS